MMPRNSLLKVKSSLAFLRESLNHATLSYFRLIFWLVQENHRKTQPFILFFLLLGTEDLRFSMQRSQSMALSLTLGRLDSVVSSGTASVIKSIPVNFRMA